MEEVVSAQERLKLLASHLDIARGLLAGLDGAALRMAATSNGNNGQAAAMCRVAEKRANEAEVALAKLSAEMRGVREQANASVRDIQKLAFQDPLTGLANGHLLEQHLEALLRRRGKDEEIVCLLIDLDRFAVVNQMMGHATGDSLLVQVSERLLQLSSDTVALGRRSEDEFTLLLAGVPKQDVEAFAGNLAEAVRKLLAEPFFVGGHKTAITASLGASSLPTRAATGQDLFRQADSALSHMKGQGRARYAMYDARLHQGMQRDMVLEFQMRHAIEAGEFFLEYLPLVWLEEKPKGRWTGRMVGVEALVRWRHRIEGVIAPSEFLPMAERTGMIVPLGEWVIREACRQSSVWMEDGIDLFINVNLYARQLLQPDLIDVVRDAVAEAGVLPSRLSFELTETVANLDDGRIDAALLQFEKDGFPLAIDNFGAGFSSLQRMSRARFLKLSREVVQGDTDLCGKAVAVAAGMGMIAVGIGVETEEQARFLAAQGCLMLQGYYFSPPALATQIAELYEAKKTWPL